MPSSSKPASRRLAFADRPTYGNCKLCHQAHKTPIVLRLGPNVKLIGGGYLVDPARLKMGRKNIARGHSVRVEFFRGLVRNIKGKKERKGGVAKR